MADKVQTGTDEGDYLDGTSGVDVLTGGKGKDRFTFQAREDKFNTLDDGDRITDYESGEEIEIAGVGLENKHGKLDYDKAKNQTTLKLDIDKDGKFDGPKDREILLDGDMRGTLLLQKACCSENTTITIELGKVEGLVESIYIALFNRPPDLVGLDFFNQATGFGSNLTAIGDLASTDEYQNRFEGMDSTQIVQSIYKSLFGRDGEPAGVTFFVNALASGQQTINTIAINILQGAQGTDAQIIANKLIAVETFLAALADPDIAAAYAGYDAAALARTFLSGVTSDPATLPSAASAQELVQSLVALAADEDGSASALITLTSAGQIVSPGSTSPDLRSTQNDDTITAPAGTFTSQTNIDAGGGTDLVIATLGEPGAVTPKLANVETLSLSTSGAGAGSEVNLSNTSGLSKVHVQDAGRDVFISQITTGTKLSLEGAVQAVAFTFKLGEVSGGSDRADIALDGVQTSKSLFLVDIETVALTNSGTTNIATIMLPNAQNVEIAGGGSLSTSFAGAHANVDASAFTGALDITFTNSFGGVSFTGGSGTDLVTFEGAASVLVDTIVYTSSTLSVAAGRDVYSNFVAGGGEDKIDLSGLLLEGSQAAITAFGVAPGDGASFAGNAVAISGSSTVYVDTNNDGVLNLDGDLAFDITGSASALNLGDILF